MYIKSVIVQREGEGIKVLLTGQWMVGISSRELG